MIKAEIVDAVRGATIEYGTVASANPASVAAGAEGSVTLTIAGAKVEDMIFVTPRALAAGLYIREVTVTADDTVTVVLRNETASPVDDAASDYDYQLVKVAA